MGLQDKARELVELIKSTSEFSQLKQARSVLDKNRSLRDEMEHFNKRQSELYSGKLSVKEAESRTAELNRKYSELSKIPEVDKLLKASKQFNDMLAKFYKTIGDSLEKELKAK